MYGNGNGQQTEEAKSRARGPCQARMGKVNASDSKAAATTARPTQQHSAREEKMRGERETTTVRRMLEVLLKREKQGRRKWRYPRRFNSVELSGFAY